MLKLKLLYKYRYIKYHGEKSRRSTTATVVEMIIENLITMYLNKMITFHPRYT